MSIMWAVYVTDAYFRDSQNTDIFKGLLACREPDRFVIMSLRLSFYKIAYGLLQLQSTLGM